MTTEQREVEMVQVRMKVGQGGGLCVVVRAHSIRRAIEMADRRFPRQEKRILFPLDPESFFAGRSCYEGIYVPVSEQVVA
jgi:hypothetical protein